MAITLTGGEEAPEQPGGGVVLEEGALDRIQDFIHKRGEFAELSPEQRRLLESEGELVFPKTNAAGKGGMGKTLRVFAEAAQAAAQATLEFSARALQVTDAMGPPDPAPKPRAPGRSIPVTAHNRQHKPTSWATDGGKTSAHVRGPTGGYRELRRGLQARNRHRRPYGFDRSILRNKPTRGEQRRELGAKLGHLVP